MSIQPPFGAVVVFTTLIVKTIVMITKENDGSWGYFKIGDIVFCPDSYYDKKKYVVLKFLRTYEHPELVTVEVGKPETPKYKFCWEARECLLLNASKRPFKNLDIKTLIKLMGKKNTEARREFDIRRNIKQYNNVQKLSLAR